MHVKLVEDCSVCLGIEKGFEKLESGIKLKAIDMGEHYLIYIDGDVSIVDKSVVKELD